MTYAAEEAIDTERKCPVCGDDVADGHPNKVYCGDKCRGLAKRRRTKGLPIENPPPRYCPVCGELVVGREDRVYCSDRCLGNKANKVYYEKNRDAILKKQRDAYKENPERHTAAVQRWKEKNPEKAKLASKRAVDNYRFANPDKVKANTRQWRINNPEAVTAHHKKYLACKAGNGGSYTPEEWNTVLESRNRRCYLCEEPGTAVEHIIPISRGGTSFIHNLLPACGRCNSSKRNKSLISWYNEQASFAWDAVEDPEWFEPIKTAYEHYILQDNAEQALVDEWYATLKEIEEMRMEIS